MLGRAANLYIGYDGSHFLVAKHHDGSLGVAAGLRACRSATAKLRASRNHNTYNLTLLEFANLALSGAPYSSQRTTNYKARRRPTGPSLVNSHAMTPYDRSFSVHLADARSP